ncbi:MAG: EF-hand domain-containing protein [Deltaproteobacteria bacterium]|nr:EF-hand domain-containing protein [Deltaproteobacteria bacterium]
MTSINGIGNSMSYSEMSAMRKQMFSKTDTDQDGKISRTELSDMVKSHTEKNDAVQKNDGGQPLSAEELFTKLDADSDGSLSMTEMDGLKDLKPPSGGPPGGPPPGGPPPGGPGAGGVKGSDDSEEMSFFINMPPL